ncbi:Zinc finger protein 598 [Sciurus carolinensis]|uniref:Zinc finger protein 598 n=1 Tax=Sciurus carolinensis TaxID=30640 RepID=A0AA41MG56_SCICA|nr:Zinc finger protein 598 [Sciurus carolinensis]
MALGCCDHSVCYRCSTKMQVLCEELLQAVFGKKLPAFATNRIQQLQHEKKHRLCRWKDGAQDYYSDYAHLHEHFPEKRFLCEEQFTHAFSTEIDLKPPGLMGPGQQAWRPAEPSSKLEVEEGRRGMWKWLLPSGHQWLHSKRCTGARTRRTAAGLRRKRPQYRGPMNPMILAPNQAQDEGPDPREASANGPVGQEDCLGLGPGLNPQSILLPTPKLKDEDFPSLSASSSSCCTRAAPSLLGLALVYPGPARGRNTFQEEDYPALLYSASKPSTTPPSLISAWNSSCSKKGSPPTPGAQAAGFNTVVLLKDTPPRTPPDLAPPVSKTPPNPGSYSLLSSPHPACIPSPTSTTTTTTTTTKVPMLTSTPRAYLVPENFWEKNLQLIQSIKDFVQSDKAHFSKFKIHLGEFSDMEWGKGSLYADVILLGFFSSRYFPWFPFVLIFLVFVISIANTTTIILLICMDL